VTCTDGGRLLILIGALVAVLGMLFATVAIGLARRRIAEARAAEERYRRTRAIDASEIAEQLARAAATSRPRLLS